MKEPERLLGSVTDELARELLSAGVSEQPEPRSAQRVMAAISMGAAAAVTSAKVAALTSGSLGAASGGALGAAGGAAGGSLGAVGGSLGAAGAVGSTSLISGVAAKVAIAAVVVSGAAFTVTKQFEVNVAHVVEAPQSAALSVKKSAQPAGVAVIADETSQPAALAVQAPPVVRTAQPAQAQREPLKAQREPLKIHGSGVAVGAALQDAAEPPATAMSAAPPPATSVLMAELELIDGARADLNAARPAAAMSQLAEHAARFPSGMLRPESMYLRMRAQLALGQSAAARQTASGILHAYPDGAHAAKAREILKQSQ